MIQGVNIMGSYLAGAGQRQSQELGMKLRDAANEMNAMEATMQQMAMMREEMQAMRQARQYQALDQYGGPTREAADAMVSENPDLRAGIIETAESLGIDPVDLATAISYETAGTFDPKKAGPTTQWGQHRGLIQFGEPQAKRYGVNWDDPLGSQLGRGKAVERYLRDAGVREGMGLLDIYSAINAGGVGLYNRSDANNGGAPGTVRDKVEKQMSGHRAKAEALMGSYRGPSVDKSSMMGGDPNALAGMTSSRAPYTPSQIDGNAMEMLLGGF